MERGGRLVLLGVISTVGFDLSYNGLTPLAADWVRAWIRENAAESMQRDDRCWWKHPGGYQARVTPGHTVCAYHAQVMADSDYLSAGASEERDDGERQLRLW